MRDICTQAYLKLGTVRGLGVLLFQLLLVEVSGERMESDLPKTTLVEPGLLALIRIFFPGCFCSFQIPCFWHQARTSRVGSRKKLPSQACLVSISSQRMQGPMSPASQAPPLGPCIVLSVPGAKF